MINEINGHITKKTKRERVFIFDDGISKATLLSTTTLLTAAHVELKVKTMLIQSNSYLDERYSCTPDKSKHSLNYESSL